MIRIAPRDKRIAGVLVIGIYVQFLAAGASPDIAFYWLTGSVIAATIIALPVIYLGDAIRGWVIKWRKRQ